MALRLARGWRPAKVLAVAAAIVVAPAALAGTDKAMSEQAVKLTTSDRIELEARLTVPDGWGPEDGAAVVCHPHPLYGGTMDNAIVVRISRALAAAGIAALRFNFRGVGASAGSYGGGDREVADVLAAAEYLRDRQGVAETRLALVGYSFGAAVAAAALAKLSPLVAYAAVALPVDPAELKTKLGAVLDPRRPVLLVAAANDDLAPVEQMLRVAMARRAVTRLEVVGEASHFFEEIWQRQAVSAAVVEFLQEQWRRSR